MPVQLLSLLNDVGCGLTYEADGGEMGRCCVKLLAPWRMGAARLSGQPFVTSSYQGIALRDGTPSHIGAISDAAVEDSRRANGIEGVAPVLDSGFVPVNVEVCWTPLEYDTASAPPPPPPGPAPDPRSARWNQPAELARVVIPGPAPEPPTFPPGSGEHTVAKCAWLTSPWTEGTPLDVLLRFHKLSVEETIVVLKALCRSVTQLHGRQIAHMDIVASKVMVDLDAGQVTLLDTGAWSVRQESVSQERRWRRGKMLELRRLRPEVLAEFPLRVHGALGDRLEPYPRMSSYAGDVQALGELALRMLTGTVPREERAPAWLDEAIGHAALMRHPALQRWVRACLERDNPSVRFDGAKQALEAIEAAGP